MNRAKHFISFVTVSLSCTRLPEQIETQDPAEKRLAESQLVTALTPQELDAPGPSPGRWRLANRKLLSNVGINLSHILIRHRNSPANSIAFASSSWRTAPTVPDRSREDAWALAEALSRQISSRQDFEAIAKHFSEDVSSRSNGGRLGWRSADNYLPWGAILDAVQTSEVDRVAGPVATIYGVHLLMRLPPPAPARIGGRHLVVSHTHAPWLTKFLGRPQLPTRSQAQALLIVENIHAQLLSQSSSFASLAREYTEHQNYSRGGYLGTWSSLELSPIPRLLSRLGELEIGQFSDPFDSGLGYQLVQRIEPQSPRPLAMHAIRVPLSSQTSVSEGEHALERAQNLLAQLEGHTSSVSELRGNLCCDKPEKWDSGRRSPQLEAALREVEPGQVVRQPVRGAASIDIAIRLDPDQIPDAPPVRFSLPEPKTADWKQYVAELSNSRLGNFFRKVAADASLSLRLPRLQKEHLLTRQREILSSGLGTISKEDLAKQLQAEACSTLGTSGCDEYKNARARVTEQLVFENARQVARYIWSKRSSTSTNFR